MHTKDSKGMDTEEDKRMGIGDGGNGTRTAHHDQRRKLSYFGHVMRKEGDCLEKEIMQGSLQHQEQENKGNQGCGGWTTWNNGPECHLKTY